MSYILLTPGPLTTSRRVKEAMLVDMSTWDVDYNTIVQSIRRDVVKLAHGANHYSCVPMQGSGSFAVEAAINSFVPRNGKLLVISNGAYGDRITQIARYLQIPVHVLGFGETQAIDITAVADTLANNPDISHVAIVHCETTTGRLNPLKQLAEIVKGANRTLILDAISSFAGMPIDITALDIDILITCANKCLEGVPGFGMVLARNTLLQQQGHSTSLCMDLHEQWRCMEANGGKWRFTSPTHTVLALAEALKELYEEGGIDARAERYRENHRVLVEGMEELGFKCLLERRDQSPIITSFYNPQSADFQFTRFYNELKQRGFVIYPGKVSKAECFRIGTIGAINSDNINQLLGAIEQCIHW